MLTDSEEGLSAEFTEADFEPADPDGPEWEAVELVLRDLDARELFAWLRGVRGWAKASQSALRDRGFGAPHGGQGALLDRLRGLAFEEWLTHRLEGALAENDGTGFVKGVRSVRLPLWAAWELWRLLLAAQGFERERAEIFQWGSWPSRSAPLCSERDAVLQHDEQWLSRVEAVVRKALGV